MNLKIDRKDNTTKSCNVGVTQKVMVRFPDDNFAFKSTSYNECNKYSWF